MGLFVSFPGRWHRRQNALWQGVGADRGHCKARPELL